MKEPMERGAEKIHLLQNSLSGTQVQSPDINVKWAHRLKPKEYPEHSHVDIQIAVPFNDAHFAVHWQTASGSQQRRTLRDSQLLIIPPDQPHQITWEQEADWVVFDFTPSLLVSAAYESITADKLEVVEHYGGPDPFIEQLALAFRREAHADHAPNHLYIDSLATLLAVHVARQYVNCRLAIRS